MKQNISREQWDELKLNTKELFWEELNYWYHDLPKDEQMPNIGQMIEFLGDDLESIEREDLLTGGAKGGWMVKSGGKLYFGSKLVVALWKAVKQKLN